MTYKVAVITRTKNRPITLERAMKSVLAQSDQDWIHIIVNDGGNVDCVDELLLKYKEDYKSRVKVIHNPISMGMEAASNIGIKNSDSMFVLIHDDDDSLEPSFLEIATKELMDCKLKSVKGVVTHTKQIFEKVTEDNIEFEYSNPFDPYLSAITLPKICEVNKFMPISFLYYREVYNEIGFYDESLPVCGDWDFNIRFLEKFDILVIKKELANYHIRLNNNINYNNTVTSLTDRHQFYRSIIINNAIRKDFADGKLGISSLLASGDCSHDIASNTWVVARVVHKLAAMKNLNFLKRLMKK